ncbi:MAG: hypothetical protein FJ207_01035 [Gemmatimonadetes bacterium]|nr:hypothetical protein [Gemmatimonadota bacterium]
MKTIRSHARALTLTAALLGALVAPSVASAQSQLDVAQARNFLGSWVLAMTSDMGNFSMNLEVTDLGGKVAATLGSPDIGMEQEITDITKSGESLVLAFAGEAQGQMFDAEVTLEPAGETLSIWFDINQGAFSMSGTGTKAGN